MSDLEKPVGDAQSDPDIIEFVPEDDECFSSGTLLTDAFPAVKIETAPDLTSGEPISAAPEVERTAAFLKLAEPKLPSLERENRARLAMQTPNRLFFYWSAGANPFQILGRAIRDQASNYSLVIKLANLKRNTEEMYPIENEGERWFDVEADGEYRAEIGFYSPSRPYIRIMYSNIVETPRKSPSRKAADEAEWRVSSDRFAKVLNVAGFRQDAFDVAIASDDADASDAGARAAFAELIGYNDEATVNEVSAEEIRYALLALAAGAALESLKFRVGARLFAILQANLEKLNAADALDTVRGHFGVDADEVTEEEALSAVYGSSRVNFPRTLRRRGRPEKLAPVGSHTLAG